MSLEPLTAFVAGILCHGQPFEYGEFGIFDDADTDKFLENLSVEHPLVEHLMPNEHFLANQRPQRN